MKKFLSLALALVLVLSSSGAFANPDMKAKLEGHWSKDMLEKEFLTYYFPYLAKNNFAALNPGEFISKENISLSLGSLSKDYNLETLIGSVSNQNMKRVDAVSMIGDRLIGLEGLEKKGRTLPFKDIGSIGEKNRQYLSLLYDLNIISGVSSTHFAPDRMVTQAEAILMLQKTRNVLESIRVIDFEIKGVVQSYNSRENVIVRERDGKVLLTITKEFPTPGYSLGIDKISWDGENHHVALNIGSPSSDSIQLQVITYKTITVEINKENLGGKAPYKFIVEGVESGQL